jgi:hypothetical protein
LGKVNKIIIGTVLVALMLLLPLNVFAQTTIAKPPTPQQFTVQYLGEDIVTKIKSIDFDLPSGYDIHYNVRFKALSDQGSYLSWREAFHYYDSPVQDSSGYTTISQWANFYVGSDDRVIVEVQALVCHYEVRNVSLWPPPHEPQILVPENFTEVDSTSDWSSPQTLTVDINGATGIPTSVEPDPVPTQTPTPYPQYTQNPNSFNIWDNPLTALFNSHWEKLALLFMASIIVVLAVGLILVWRKVGNLSANKQPV